MVVAVEGDAQVRESRDVPAGAGGGPVRQEGRRAVGREGWIDQWDGRTADGAQLDGDRVVEDASSIGEAGEVSSEDAEGARAARG